MAAQGAGIFGRGRIVLEALVLVASNVSFSTHSEHSDVFPTTFLPFVGHLPTYPLWPLALNARQALLAHHDSKEPPEDMRLLALAEPAGPGQVQQPPTLLVLQLQDPVLQAQEEQHAQELLQRAQLALQLGSCQEAKELCLKVCV